MELRRNRNVTSLFLLLLFYFCAEFGTAIHTISTSQFLKDPESIISNGSVFKLGFFSPANSSNRYVGIWYNDISVSTVIWVANRNKPLNDSSGILTISENGNLDLLNGQREILWSSKVSSSAANATAQILDSGNLVLRDEDGGRIIWESFQYLSDSFLPNMKISTNVRTGEKQVLTSWTSPTDPSIGSFTVGVDPLNIPEIFIWNGNQPYWRSGPWNNQIFIGIPDMDSVYLDGFNLAEDEQGTYSLTLTYADASFLTKFVLNSQGNLEQTYWDDQTKNWELNWVALVTKCDVYGKCGAFGRCDSEKSPICSCLRGYKPKNEEEWSKANWTSGCVRKTPLQCQRINSGGVVGKGDGFLKQRRMKVPAFAQWSSALEDKCKDQCLNNCSCIAYAYYLGIGCMSWSGNLVDIQKFSGGGADLYIRVAHSELDKNIDVKVIIIITVTIGAFSIAICILFLWRWKAQRKAKEEKRQELLLFDRGESYTNFCQSMLGDNTNLKLQELPLVNFEKLAAATNNFHPDNKLGQGGFGPVYRGKFQDGQEIAVKRLSRASGQGIEEFLNEVVVISKVQHLNLVRLLGCCVEGDEKMLVYEYMPNKSLDAFLFDRLEPKLLDWRKRFNIIEGIGRGILYLHRDSRLRIIHRDLKPSNILLDEELNPKISDFGMARIFGRNEERANTRRVVGTYGYMSPEYAMEGQFSEKSDVFSFGVLLLEIVSGRKNTAFYHDEHFLSLLGFAWKMWKEDDIAGLINPTVSDPCFRSEILRCVHVGLLCVQELPKDRPTMSTILSMLNSEIVDLPTPKKPAFTERQIASDAESSQQAEMLCSINNVTVTMVAGR